MADSDKQRVFLDAYTLIRGITWPRFPFCTYYGRMALKLTQAQRSDFSVLTPVESKVNLWSPIMSVT